MVVPLTFVVDPRELAVKQAPLKEYHGLVVVVLLKSSLTLTVCAGAVGAHTMPSSTSHPALKYFRFVMTSSSTIVGTQQEHCMSLT
jgi:hypothetical protein